MTGRERIRLFQWFDLHFQSCCLLSKTSNSFVLHINMTFSESGTSELSEIIQFTFIVYTGETETYLNLGLAKVNAEC